LYHTVYFLSMNNLCNPGAYASFFCTFFAFPCNCMADRLKIYNEFCQYLQQHLSDGTGAVTVIKPCIFYNFQRNYFENPYLPALSYLLLLFTKKYIFQCRGGSRPSLAPSARFDRIREGQDPPLQFYISTFPQQKRRAIALLLSFNLTASCSRSC